MVRTIKYLN